MQPITLGTLSQATEQEVFDQVAVHLITQGVRAVNELGLCVYLTADGKKCAAGCLISTEEYKKLSVSVIDLNNVGWITLRNREIVPEENFTLVCDLQGIHDSLVYGRKVGLTTKLKNLAKVRKLDSSIVQTTIENLE